MRPVHRSIFFASAVLIPLAWGGSPPPIPRTPAQAAREIVQADGPNQDQRIDLFGDPLPPGAVARMGSVRLRSTRWVEHVVFSPDGKTILSSGGTIGTVLVWDAESGRQIGRLFEPSRWGDPNLILGDPVFSPDGSRLAIAKPGDADDNIIALIWDAERARLHAELKITPMPSRIRVRRGAGAVAWSPDGRALATSDAEAILRLWDPVSGTEILTRTALDLFPPDVEIPGAPSRFGALSAMVFLSDGRTIAGVMGSRIVLLDVTGEAPPRFIQAHLRDVGGLALSPDGRRLYSGGTLRQETHFDATLGSDNAFSSPGIRVWDPETGEMLAEFAAEGLEGAITGLSLSPDGSRIAATYSSPTRNLWDQTVSIWDTRSGEETARLDNRLSPSSNDGGVAWSPDGRRIAAGGPGTLIRLWDAASGEPLDPHDATHHSVVHNSLVFSPDGGSLLSMAGYGTIRLWDTGTGRHRLVIAGPRVDTMGGSVSPDGRWVAAQDVGNRVKVWEVETGRVARTIEIQTELTASAFSPDSATLALNLARPHRFQTGVDVDSLDYIQLFDVATGEPGVPLLGVPAGSAEFMWFRPGGMELVAAHSGVVRVWELSTGVLKFKFSLPDGDLKNVLALAPDGRHLVALGTQYEIITIKNPTGGGSSQRGPAGPVELSWWDLETGQMTRSVPVAQDASRRVRFAGGPDLLLTGSGTFDAGGAYLIDARTGETLLRLDSGRREAPGALAVSPDGRLAATGQGDGTILIWDLTRRSKR